ncbi:MAG TPA: hypothetical protein VFX86_01185 [Candidatus Saccharimonadales bacterium]|nr:hypothetical protein [Candidatus Saccharimonadales bacterium]
MTYGWDFERYIAEVENGTDNGLQDYQQRELEFVLATPDLSERTVIDVGAGYGRVLPKIAPHAQKYIAVERDENELVELRRRAADQNNSMVIEGSGNYLAELVPAHKALLISLQNTLGPWVGNREEAIAQLAEVSQIGKGDVIVSLFCAEALTEWGLPMYASTSGLLGNYDADASDIGKGIFRTDMGYESRWFFETEREDIKSQLGGSVVRQLTDPKFEIFQVSHNPSA